MLYSSVWTRVLGATAVMMIGLIVACCTLASMRKTTSPPRWIRPRMGGLSFSRGVSKTWGSLLVGFGLISLADA